MKSQPKPVASENELYDRAVKLLMQKGRSRWEMRRLLEKRSPKQRWVESVLDKCVARGYLDDVKYAVQLARMHAERKRQGRRRVFQELRARGLADDLASRAVEEVCGSLDEEALLRRSLEVKLKRLRRPLNAQQKKRLYDQLMRAGFTTEQILRELKRFQISISADAGFPQEEFD